MSKRKDNTISTTPQEEVSIEGERKAKRLLDQQIAISQFALALGESLDVETVYETIYKYVREFTNTLVLIVSIYDDQEKIIQPEYAIDNGLILDRKIFPSIPLGKPEQDTWSRVIHSGKPFYSPNFLQDIDISQKHYHIEENGSLTEITSVSDLEKVSSRSALLVPLKVKGKISGVMQLQSPLPNAYTPEDIELLVTLASFAAIAIENARLYEAIQQELDERTQAQEALRRERDQAQQYLDVASVILIAHDKHGRVMRANRKACEVLGYEEREMLGKIWVNNFVPKRFRKKVSHVFDMLLDGNLAGSEFNENPVLTRKGEERFVLWHNAVVRDKKGNIIGHLGSGEDITERKRAEEHAKREAARVTSLARVAARMNAQLDLQTVLNIICEETAAAMDFPASSIDLLSEEDGWLVYASGFGIPKVYEDKCCPTPVSIYENFVSERKDIFIFPDIQSFSDLPNIELYKKLDFRTVAMVKLEREGQMIGILSVNTFGKTREINEDDKAILRSLGNLAVQAIVNARLFEDARHQASELARSNELVAVLTRLSAELQSTLDPEQIIRIMGEELRALGIASFFATLDSDENALIIQGATIEQEAVAFIEEKFNIFLRGFPVRREMVPDYFDRLILHKQPVFSKNVLDEGKTMIPKVPQPLIEMSMQIFGRSRSRGIYLPLTSGERVFGVLGLHSPDLYESDVATFSVFANSISAALENARLYQEVQSELQERKRTEAILQETEERYRALVEQVPAIAYTDSAEEMGKTLYINPQLKKIAGYDPEEWITDNDFWLRIIHPEDRERVYETYVRSYQAGEPFNLEYRLVAADGRTIWFHDEATLIRDRSGRPLFWQGIMSNVTNLKQAEEALREALVEKEVLLREVHHRVKNNLQAVIYLIEGRIDQVTDQKTISLLRGLEEQARTMALVYEQLYQSENLAEVKMERYLQVLAESIREAFNSGRQIELSVESEDITLDIASAMPCGLMVTELLTNSLKHAFPDTFVGNPKISIELSSKNEHYDLVVRDNGVGLPEDLDEQSMGSMGLKLVRLWATHQMGGTFEIERGEGVVVHITFPKRSG